MDSDSALAMGHGELTAPADERVLLLGRERIATTHAVLERGHAGCPTALVALDGRAGIRDRHRRGRVSHASRSLLIFVGGL